MWTPESPEWQLVALLDSSERIMRAALRGKITFQAVECWINERNKLERMINARVSQERRDVSV